MNTIEEQDSLLDNSAPAPSVDLSTLVVSLLKGVIYREGDERLWSVLLNLQAKVRDYVAILALDLVLDEAEGYAFLKSRTETDDEANTQKLPRLIVRRPLSFPVSLLLALLRKKLAESDAGGGDTRLVLTRDDIVEMLRVFTPDSSNEAKMIDQIESHIKKVVDLGFLRRLKSSSGQGSFEVRRILKAYVDAQWLADFDEKLAIYQARLAGEESAAESSEDE